MHQYHVLTTSERAAILRDRIRQLEAEHWNQELTYRLGVYARDSGELDEHATGLQMIQQAITHQATLDRAIARLLTELETVQHEEESDARL